ncbi:hypothetical protein O181_038560 [Austropuccinia psidii MF-1]|uniref:Mannose-6-phosphate isomerase n=1 Tax=Austropuccinia psidii MF-1 TaxID=1389203 RepID=A0A9Q3DD46_9BASI|nr:hypothetical protein [Austropuccinia psidii MF-1]
MAGSIPSVFQLIPQVQSYDWGKIGSQSKVAQFASHSKDFSLDESKPYAELWMGAHPNLPSKLSSNSQSLSDLINSDPSKWLGHSISVKFKNQLPFLFKVLSIQKALSIQAHPDLDLAIKLHQNHPKIYKDPNHKPEMAIAITPFSGFCGFRPLNQISNYLNQVPELADLIGHETVNRFLNSIPINSTDPSIISSINPNQSNLKHHQALLKELFSKLMNAPDQSVIDQVTKLIKRIQSNGGRQKEFGTDEELLLRLNEQFPNDIGIFCTFLLNVIHLQPGQAAFLQADEPHAYLTGDIIECMAASDNVVRAGLTPKLRDVSTLTEMLTYSYGPSESQLMKPQLFKSCKYTTLYDPPIQEFSVLLTNLSPNQQDKHPPINGPSILIVTHGFGSILVCEDDQEIITEHEGQIYFIAPQKSIKLIAKENNGFIIYRAFVEA